MFQGFFIGQFLLIIAIIVLIVLIGFITDLPEILGLTFSKKETIQKYIEDTYISKVKGERTLCTFRMIGSRYYESSEEVYIFLCICKYKKEKKEIDLIDVEYRKGIVTLSRIFGIYKVIKVDTKEEDIKGYFPMEIMSTDDYEESTSEKEKRLLKEANIKKAKKKFKLKKVYKVK